MIRDHVHFVPAGLEKWPNRTGQVFVKLEKNEKASIHRGRGYKRVRLHDRTLHILQESTLEHRLLDAQLDCDYMVPFQNPVELRGRTRLVLVNPIHADDDFENLFRPHGIKIISDSGGFQLLRGLSEFIHPGKPVAFYNAHTDIGMPLDFPIRNSYEPVVFDAITRLMKANDAYMIPRLNENVKLAVVSHGSSVEMRKRRLDAVYRPTSVVAIAGLNTSTEVDYHNKQLVALANAMYVISQTRDTTKYFHFLGVTSKLWIIIYALLVGTGYVKSCGGDSVSFRMSAITGKYHNRFSYYATGSAAIAIEKHSKKSVNTSCVCPICQAVSDLNLLAEFQLCESHNIWYTEQEKDLICDSVQSYLDGHLSLQHLADQWLGRGQHRTLKVAVDYINNVIGKGFHPIKSSIPTLFGTQSTAPGARDKKTELRYIRVIRNYEKFYKKRFL